MTKNYLVSRNDRGFTINSIRVPIQCHPALLLGFLIFAAAALFATSSFGAATVYVPMGSGNEILIIDAESHTITGRIKEVNAIHGLATAKGNDYLVAGSYAEYDDSATSAPPKPTGVSEDEHQAHHAKSTSKKQTSETISHISVLRASDGKIVRRITVPGAVHHVALTPDGKFAIATHPGQDSVSIVDLVEFSLVKTLKTGSTPNYAAVSNDGNWAYVSNSGDNTISEISIETWSVNRSLRADNSPEHLVLAADGTTLFVANIDDGTVSAIPLRDDTDTQTYEVGGVLHGIDLSDDQKTVFVSGTEKNKLYAIDLVTGSVRSAVVAPSPYHLTTIPGTGMLYLTSVERPTLYVVDQKSLRVRHEINIHGKGHQMVVRDR